GAVVAQVSKPAVWPISNPPGLSIFLARRIRQRQCGKAATRQTSHSATLLRLRPPYILSALARESFARRRSTRVEGLLLALANLWLIFSGIGVTEYKRKPDFKKTAEPAGQPLPKKYNRALGLL